MKEEHVRTSKRSDASRNTKALVNRNERVSKKRSQGMKKRHSDEERENQNSSMDVRSRDCKDRLVGHLPSSGSQDIIVVLISKISMAIS